MSNIHVMSPNELEKLPDGSVVWQERKEPNVIMPMIMYNGIIANYEEYLYPNELRAMDDIQLNLRYWNYRPTIDTMQNEPWIIREEWRV